MLDFLNKVLLNAYIMGFEGECSRPRYESLVCTCRSVL